MPGIPSAFGAGANATYSAIGEQSYANRKERKMLRSDLESMQHGELGYSDAQRNALLANQQRQASGQTADQMAQLQRAQAAGGARAGGYDTQRGQLLAGQQAGMAQYNTGIEGQSSQLAQNQRAQILGRLAAQTGKNSAFWNNQGQIAAQGAENFSGGSMMGGTQGGQAFRKGPLDYAGIDAASK